MSKKSSILGGVAIVLIAAGLTFGLVKNSEPESKSSTTQTTQTRKAPVDEVSYKGVEGQDAEHAWFLVKGGSVHPASPLFALIMTKY